MSAETPQDRPERGWMTYPSGGWRKLFFRMPVYLWRMGLGWALPRQFLLLTHTGRRSGAPRRTMLEHYRYGAAYYVASGWGPRSQWIRNIQANPRVTVQTWRDGATGAQAEQVKGDAELTDLYHYFRQTSPFWGVYLQSLGIEDTLTDFLAKKDRMLLFRLAPTVEPGPPPQPTDLVWVWPALLVLALAPWSLLRPKAVR
jgi:deazaflavin-dependent oxidoreductase (nitroreductase family)